MSVRTSRPVSSLTLASRSKPAAKPGPRGDPKRDRLALSKDALKTTGNLKLSSGVVNSSRNGDVQVMVLKCARARKKGKRRPVRHLATLPGPKPSVLASGQPELAAAPMNEANSG